jgi:hypothetical protein
MLIFNDGLATVNCLVQGQNDRCFLPCQLGDSILQPFGYKSNSLTLGYLLPMYVLSVLFFKYICSVLIFMKGALQM